MVSKKLIEVKQGKFLEAWAYVMGMYLVWYFETKDFLEKYHREIEDYKRYQDQKRFAILIEVVIRREMEKFHVKEEEIRRMMEEKFKTPDFKEYMDNLVIPPLTPSS